MRAKLEAMERRLAKMDAVEKQRLSKVDAIERRQEATETRLAAVEQQQSKYSFIPNKSTC